MSTARHVTLCTLGLFISSGSIGIFPQVSAAPHRTLPGVNSPPAQLVFPPSPEPPDFFRAHILEEPLVPAGHPPTAEENSALAEALLAYAKRTSPDDFSSLTDFLDHHPGSAWELALLTNLGLEYYRTAHYSLALGAWARASEIGKDQTEQRAKALADRAIGELAYMYGRLGRMQELESLLSSVQNRVFVGCATERIYSARAGLFAMKTRPEISFRCGPLALHRIKLATDRTNLGFATRAVYNSASTPQGFSLPQVAALSKTVGLNYQMAFRPKGMKVPLVVPAVIHWKVGHYAAIIRQENGRYLLQDPTFRNDVWATAAALDEEASGYFLIPSGPLPHGWRSVAESEGKTVYGKGNVPGPDPGGGDNGGNDGGNNGGNDNGGNDDGGNGDDGGNIGGDNGSNDDGGNGDNGDNGDDGGDNGGDNGDNGGNDGGDNGGDNGGCTGMPVSHIGLAYVSLGLQDAPVGYRPPRGVSMRMTVNYNQRDVFQPANFNYSNLGPKWTFRWISYITDNPYSPGADVQYYRMGGYTRIFTGFSPATQAYALQQYDLTKLTRTSPNTYVMVSRDGTRRIFGQPDGAVGTSRRIFLTQLISPSGESVQITYDSFLRIAAVTDALGQVTTLSYGSAIDIYKITQVTDPFGRTATFTYDGYGRLVQITDAIAMSSQFTYDPGSDFINALTTPYGTTHFVKSESGSYRAMERQFPDGSRDRAEFNESTSLGISQSVSPSLLPIGMNTHNDYMAYRNTYYWGKIACAQAYGDYTKARIYHWLHTPDFSSASSIVESTKKALEGRIWRDYLGQSDPIAASSNTMPAHVGRVLDDGTTQLYSYTYNTFGKPTQVVDPLGRTFTYVYDTNDVDLLELRQTRAGNNDLLFKRIYNAQHRITSSTDTAGQTTTATYNSHGQVLTVTNPKHQTLTYSYDANGYLTNIQGTLADPKDSISLTYDQVGRIRTYSNVDGYTLTFDYDNLDRVTQVTHPDGTTEKVTYNLLDIAAFQDRAGRITSFAHNAVRQLTQSTDPLGRSVYYQWCTCGAAKSITDALGRTTAWEHDLQGRVTAKTFPDGSRISYQYENTTSRIHQRVDEKLQITTLSFNLDNTLASKSYVNSAVPTPAVSYNYDRNYRRRVSMTDGTGITIYNYNPITTPPSLGAARVGSVVGPLPNSTISYTYDELGRRIVTSVNGSATTTAFDAAGRVLVRSNILGAFSYTYDGNSVRPLNVAGPNGYAVAFTYLSSPSDRRLQKMTYSQGATPLAQFTYGYDLPAGRVTNWVQQAGAAAPTIASLTYDPANQLLSSVTRSNSAVVKSYAWSYDAAGNRLGEQVDTQTTTASYNVLNELTATQPAPATAATYSWDAEHRLSAVVAGNYRAEFTYDGRSRLVALRELTNGSETSNRHFLWNGREIAEERTAAGAVVKRFFPQGVRVETGAATGSYLYTRDHLGSVRQLVDATGTVRGQFAYAPYGQRTQVSGTLDSDFGYGGMFYHSGSGLNLTWFRAYDPQRGRWLSRDPLRQAEQKLGPNLYAYAHNDPINRIDPAGLDDGFSTSPGGLGPQLNFGLGNFNFQLQAPWQYPGTGYDNFDLSLNLNLTPNLSLVCDASSQSLGVDVKGLGPFEVQVTASGPSSGQVQVSVDLGNPNIGFQGQYNWGQNSGGSIGIGGRF